MKARCLVFSHIGNSRQKQEDNFLVGSRLMLLPSDGCEQARERMPYFCTAMLPEKKFGAFVCDGMGGHACGELASLTAAQLLKKRYDDLLQAAAVSVAAIREVISGLNGEFCRFAAGSPERQSMGTTLCGVVSWGNHLYGINVGDSRLYMYRNGVLRQISTDHSEGQRLLNLGLISEDEVQSLPHRKAIYKHFGQRVKLTPDVFEITDAARGTLLLLATDGLTDALTDGEISGILRVGRNNLNSCGRSLLQQALSRNLGRGDNITLILIEF